jgi:uncharacterized membrane protein
LIDPVPSSAPSSTGPTAQIDVGLIVSPAIDEEAGQRLRDEVEAQLAGRYPSVNWGVELLREDLLAPPAHLTELVDAARDRLLDKDWDLAAVVTELPLRLRRRPLLSHASPTHGVALVSLPALGPLQRLRRLRDSVVDTLGALLAEPLEEGKTAGLGVQRRLAELASDLDDAAADQQGVVFLARVVSGNIRLLLGMIRANHPWRLAGHLSRALLGALAAVVFALVTSDVWRIAASASPLSLTVLMLGSIAAAVATLIVAHGLWERAASPHVREQVMLFNLATTGTVTLGIVSLYVAVFLVTLSGAGLMIEPSLLAASIHQSAGLSDYLRLAWLASTIATAGGALGGLVESDVAVREAAYAYLPEEDPAPPAAASSPPAGPMAERKKSR